MRICSAARQGNAASQRGELHLHDPHRLGAKLGVLLYLHLQELYGHYAPKPSTVSSARLVHIQAGE